MRTSSTPPRPAVSALVLLAAVAAPAAGAPVTAAPVPRDPLAADVAAIRTPNAWPVRCALVGWTATHQAVVRRVVCDVDAGGGRGPYCEFVQCIAQHDDAPATADRCVDLGTLDLNQGDAARATLSLDAARAAAAAQLASLGPLAPGRPMARSTVTLSTAHHAVTLSTRRRAGKVRREVFTFPARDEDVRPNRVTRAAVTSVSASPDAACVVAIGRYTYDSYYEGVPVHIPSVFARVICD